MACNYDDGYEDARHREARRCESDEYEDGYSVGLRTNRRLAEERAEQEAYEQALAEQEMREAEARAQYEADLAQAQADEAAFGQSDVGRHADD